MKGSTFLRISRRDFLHFAVTSAVAVGSGACSLGRKRSEMPMATESINQGVPIKSTPIRSEVSPTQFSAEGMSPGGGNGRATMIIRNAKVLTLDAQDRISQAMAVEGNKILAVGNDDQILSLASANAQIIDAGGRVVSPGFIDPHLHYGVAALTLSYFVDFMPPEVKTMEDLQKKIAAELKKIPEGEWLVGYYLGLGEGMPQRSDLDPVSPKHPVWVMQLGGHIGSANSLALKIAGITAKTANPEGGIIGRDENGEPNGEFYNHRAMDVLRRVIPHWTNEQVARGMLDLQASLLAAGITSFHDNNIRDLEVIKTYQELSRSGQLKVRNALYFTLEYPQDIKKVSEIDPYEDGITRFAGYKFLIDGQAPTAFCREPHKGTAWELSTWEEKSFKDTIRQLHESGRQICVHCYGDAAVDLTLEAYEGAMNAAPFSDSRHRIEHAMMTTAQANDRIKELGVVVEANPTFIRMASGYWKTIFSQKQMERFVVTREWLDKGIHLTTGSDYPTTPWMRPQDTILAAITRLGADKQVLSQEQKLTFMEALRAHTIGAAYAVHEENSKGSLEAGKLADMVIWNQDPTSAKAAELFNMPAMYMTILDGKVVHQA